MGLKEKTVSSIKWNTVATVVTMVIGILQLAILTRLLDKADFGLIAIATMVISFTDIFAELGIASALIHKQNITQEEYSSVYWLNIGLSVIVFALTCLVAPMVATFYKAPALTLIIRLLSLKIVLTAFGKLFQTIKSKNLEFGFISKVRILSSVVGIVASTAFAWYGFGVMSLVYGELLKYASNQIIYAIAGMKQMRIMFHFRFSEIRDVLRIGGYQLGSQVMDFVASRLDILLIGKFFSMDELGVYNIAKDLINKPFMIVNSVSANVFSAAFAKIQNNIQSVINNYNKLIKTIAMIMLPVYCGMFIFADLLVAILYAPSFSEVSFFIRILSLVGICSSLTSQAGTVMIALGRTDLGMRWTIVRIALSTVVLLTTARLGLIILAEGQSVLSVATLLIYFFVVIRPMFYNSLSLKQYFSAFMGVVLGALMLSAPFAIFNICFNVPVTVQVAMVVAYIALYCFYLYVFYRVEFKEIIKYIVPSRYKR